MDATRICVTLLVVVLMRFSQAVNPYCFISTCASMSNTLCKFSTTTWAPACETAYEEASVISDEEKTNILTTNNLLRQIMAKGVGTGFPPAANMRELVWDDELANLAQTHAQQCVDQRDACRNVKRFRVGQNIAMKTSDDEIDVTNWADILQTWSNEGANLQVAHQNSFPASLGKPIDQFSQLIWAETHTIGCGVASYKINSTTDPNPYKAVFVCNFGPAGNRVGSKIYIKGNPGSACPVGTVNKDGLCAKKM